MAGVCGMQHVVEADGSVYPCDFYVLDGYRLGNLRENSLEEVNQRRKTLGFVEQSRAVDPVCQACGYFPCAGEAAAATVPQERTAPWGATACVRGIGSSSATLCPGCGSWREWRRGGWETILSCRKHTGKKKSGAMSKHNAWQDSLDKDCRAMHCAFSLGCRKQIGNRIACAVFRQWHGLFSLSAYCCSFPLPCLRIRRAQRKTIPYAATCRAEDGF